MIKHRSFIAFFILIHLQFWGCSYFQTTTYPELILIEDNEQVSIRYEFAEKRIRGNVDTGNFTPEAYIVAIFHKGALDAPIVQKMFFPGDTLEFMVAENHLNASPEGNVAVLKPIGDDLQQEEVSFSYTEKDDIILPPFQLHKVPYVYEKQFIHLSDEFTDSVRLDSGGIGVAGLVEGLPFAKYPTRGSERNISSEFDSISINAIPNAKRVKLFIFSTPDEAELYIDGQLRGMTPIGILDLSIGAHEFKLLKENFAPLVKTLDIQPSKRAKVEFRMNRLNVLHFMTEEEGLKFVLDDEHEWLDKKIKLQIENGVHMLSVYKKNVLKDRVILKSDWNTRMEYSLPICQKKYDDSQVRYKTGQYVESVAILEEMLQMESCNEELSSRAQYYIGWNYANDQFKPDVARKAYQEVVDNYPEGFKYVEYSKLKLASYLLSDQAEVAYKAGNFTEALALREEVIQQKRSDKELAAKNQYLAGYIYHKNLNDLDKAQAAYNNVITIHPKSGYATKALNKLNVVFERAYAFKKGKDKGLEKGRTTGISAVQAMLGDYGLFDSSDMENTVASERSDMFKEGKDVVFQKNWNNLGMETTGTKLKSGITTKTERYDSGNLLSEKSMKGNELHGLSWAFHEDHSLQYLSLYIDGKHVFIRYYMLEENEHKDYLFPDSDLQVVVKIEEEEI